MAVDTSDRTMITQEFTKRRDMLGEVIARGLQHYAVWQKLAYRDPTTATWSLDQLNTMYGQLNGFFAPVARSLLDSAYLQFAKVFDSDPQTASLRVLMQAALEDVSLVPGTTLQGLQKIEQGFTSHESLLGQLKKRRDQYIAHADANPTELVSQVKKDFDEFIDRVKAAFIDLSEAHDGIPWVFGSLTAKSEQDTADVIDFLIEKTEKN